MTNSKIKFVQTSISIIDIFLTIDAYFVAYFVRNQFFHEKLKAFDNFKDYIWVLGIIVPLWLAALHAVRAYDFIKNREHIITTALKVFTAVSLGTMSISTMFYLMKDNALSRLFYGLFVVANFLALVIERVLIKFSLYIASKKFNKFINKKNILIVGTGELGQAYHSRIERYSLFGNNVIGFLESEGFTGRKNYNQQVLGSIENMEAVHKEYHIDEVVIALPVEEIQWISYVLGFCEREGLRAKILPAYSEFACATVEELDGLPILNVKEVPLDYLQNRIIKRTFDIVVSLLSIAIFSPFLIAVAIGVKLTSPGPVFFKQERVGARNRTFMMMKFRSMKVQKAEEEKIQWTTENDPRKTRFGAFIRKTSLDELPQLFNVLMGDMSIIGPRPERPYWVDRFKTDIPEYMQRHFIKCGITGWAQVNGWRGDTSIEERIKCDNYYIRNWNFWMDIKILFLTVFKGFVNKNAY